MFPTRRDWTPGTSTRAVAMATAILFQLLLGALVIHGDAPVAEPAPETTDNEQVIKTLRRAHNLRSDDRDAFLEALQSVAGELPEVPVATETGAPTPVTYRFNAFDQQLDAVRFRVPKDRPRDLVWRFFMTPKGRYTWYIAPATGGSKIDFKSYHRITDFVSDPTAGITGLKRRVGAFQFCAAENLLPGKEYILWFDFADPGPCEMEISVACLPAGKTQNTLVHLAEALGETRIADALKRSKVSGLDRDWYNANWRQDFNKALVQSETALAKSPEDPNVVRMHHFILYKLKRWREAEEFGANRAIPVAEKSGDKELLFWTLWNQVMAIWLDDHADRTPGNSARLKAHLGTELADRARALAEELDSDNLRWRAMMLQAIWYEHSLAPGGHQWGKATEFYKEGLAVAQRNAWAQRISRAMGGVAEVLACIGKLDTSEEWSRVAGRPPHPYIATQRKNWREMYDRRKQIAYLERETLRQPNERLQREVIGWNQRGPYDNAIVGAMRLGKPEEAIETAERLNNRTMGTILGAKSEQARGAVVTQRKERETAMKAKMDDLRRQLATARKSSNAAVASIQRDLTIHGAMLEQLHADIAADELEIKAAGLPPPMKVANMQALLDDDTALLVYGVTWTPWIGSGLAAGITHDAMAAKLSADLFVGSSEKEGFQPFMNPYLALMTKPTRTREEEAELRKLNDDLYHIIVAPIREQVENRRHWIIVPSGPLCQVPIHLLRDPDGRYLFESHSISYIPSVGVLKYALTRNREVGGNVTVVANPALAAAGASLKFAEIEARTVCDVFPTANLLLGDRATETAVKESLPTSDVLHFACHGLLNTEFPMRSALALTPDDANDGLLTAREVCDYPVNAGLVVLSACESGSGGMSAGWIELVGMNRGWLLAGAPSVMTALWKLDDRSTSELMGEFYKNLKTMSRAEALQQAQLTMMKKYDNPYYWGAFVLYGDYR